VAAFLVPAWDINTRHTRWYPNGELAVARARLRGPILRAGSEATSTGAPPGTSLIGKLVVESAYRVSCMAPNGFRASRQRPRDAQVGAPGRVCPNLRTKSTGACEDLLLSIDLKVSSTAEAHSPGRGSVRGRSS